MEIKIIVGALFEAQITAGGGGVLVDAVQLEQNTAATDYAGEATAMPGIPSPAPSVDELAAVMVALQVAPATLPAGGTAGTVSLTVSLPPKAKGQVFATGGIPLPRGALFEPDLVHLTDTAGQPVRMQSGALARYANDGSIRSLYVAFAITLPTPLGETPHFTLHYGTRRSVDVPIDGRVTVEEDAAGVTVTTGPLRFRLDRDSFRLFSMLWFDGDGDGQYTESEQMTDAKAPGGCIAEGDDGELWESARNRLVLVVERPGPIEAVIRVQGWHCDGRGRARLGTIVRLHAYAGSAHVRVIHTFENLMPPGTPALLRFSSRSRSRSRVSSSTSSA